MVRQSSSGLPKAACLPLHCTIVRSHLEYPMEANCPNMTGDFFTTALQHGSRGHGPYAKRLRQLNLFSLERRRLRADHVIAFKISKGLINLIPSDLLLRPPRTGMRAHTYRLLRRRLRLTSIPVQIVRRRLRWLRDLQRVSCSGISVRPRLLAHGTNVPPH